MPPASGTHTITNIEGFEAGVASVPNHIRWQNHGFRDGSDEGNNHQIIASSNKRTGDLALLVWSQGYVCVPLAFASNGLPNELPVTYNAVIIRCYVTLSFVAPDATKQVFGIGKEQSPLFPPPTPNLRVEVDTSSELSLDGTKAGSPTSLTLNQAYLLELVYDVNNSVLELYVDGALEVQKSKSLLAADYLMLGDERSGGLTYRSYDDLLIEAHRTNPAVVNLMGEGRVLRLDPNATGTDDAWTPSSGSDNYLMVDDFNNTDSDTTYAHNGGAAIDLTVNVEAFAGHAGPPAVSSAAQPRAVKVNSLTRATSGTPSWRGVRVRSGSTTNETSASSSSATTYESRYAKVYQNDPDTGVAWTRSGVDAIEAGLGIDNTGTGRVTAIQTQVEYSDDPIQSQAVLVILPQ